MATIKSYTDISQSKKLAEILPIESADYTHLGKDEDNVLTRSYFESCSSGLGEWIGKDEMSPCWSFACLLGILPILDNRPPVMSKTFDEKYRVVYHSTTYEKAILTSDYDNPIDACVAMIEKLHELNLL